MQLPPYSLRALSHHFRSLTTLRPLSCDNAKLHGKSLTGGPYFLTHPIPGSSHVFETTFDPPDLPICQKSYHWVFSMTREAKGLPNWALHTFFTYRIVKLIKPKKLFKPVGFRVVTQQCITIIDLINKYQFIRANLEIQDWLEWKHNIYVFIGLFIYLFFDNSFLEVLCFGLARKFTQVLL